MSPNAHFLLAVTNFFKISHLYFLSSNLTFVPLFFFWGFFQSFFSFFGLCFPAKDFPFHIALSSFLSHPAAPVALPYWTSLYSQPFVISLQQQVYYPAVPNPNPNYKAGCLTAPSSGAGPVQAEQPRQAVPQPVAAHRCGSRSQIDLPKCRTGMATPGSGLWCLRRGSSWSCRVLLILLSCRAERVRQDSPGHQHTDQELQEQGYSFSDSFPQWMTWLSPCQVLVQNQSISQKSITRHGALPNCYRILTRSCCFIWNYSVYLP